MIDQKSLVKALRESASQCGLLWGGVAPAVESTGFSDLVRWIESGYAGEMTYIADRLDAYRHPNGVLDGVQSIVVLALPYDEATKSARVGMRGRVARYAHSGTDYHDTIHPKLKLLCKQIAETVPRSRSRGVVDTAPLMERELAQLAGFGWRGKNTLLLNKKLGSYFFLCCLLTDVPLPIDTEHRSSHCGTCRACLDACPTDAFPQAGLLDATRCISYLTIEHRGPIPIELREGIGDWLFGCDVCQEVCPWNDKPSRNAIANDNTLDSIDLGELFDLSDQQFRERFRKTAFWRIKRRGILRNAAIVMGNSRSVQHLAALHQGLWDDESIVRGASAWALGKIAVSAAMKMLEKRRALESDTQVRTEIDRVLRQAVD